MKFSIVIINYRTPDLTIQCLDSIFRFCKALEFEIILIDNGSGDDSLGRFENRFSGRIKLIENSVNLGFAKANNQGARLASGEIIFFLNSDTLLLDNVLSRLKDFFDSNSNIGISSPELFLDHVTPQSKAYGLFPKLSDLILKNMQVQKEASDRDHIDWVSGAALAIRKDVFDKIGGWDENYFMYMEDTDLCWQTKRLGYRVDLCPQAKIIHLGGKSLNNDKQRRKYYFKSQNYFFKKHYGLLISLVMRIIRYPYKIKVLYF